jgi:metal-sulfur cluster biosynthetic enzyme
MAATAELTKESILEKLKQVQDPEIQYNIVDLGLIYDVRIDSGMVIIDMTLTSPTCPVGPYLLSEVEKAAKAVPGVTGVAVNVVWEPLWGPERMSDEAKVALGI